MQRILFRRFIYALAANLILAVTANAQTDSQIVTSRGDTIDFNDPDKQLKYILSNELARTITGNTFAGLGNYAAISTADNTLSGAVNIVRQKSVLGIKVGGGLTDGISTLFEKENLNTNVTLGLTWNILIGTPQASVDYMGIKKIKDQSDALLKTYRTDSVKALAFQVNQIGKIGAKQKEIDELDRIIAMRQNTEWTDFYRKQETLLQYELETLKNERTRYRTKMEEVMTNLRANHQGEQLKLETLKAEAFEYAFDKKIRDKEKEIKAIQEELVIRSDPARLALDATNKAVLERELEVLRDDLAERDTDMEIVRLRYEMELARRKIWADFDAIKPDDIKFKWFTIGGEVTQNKYSLYDATRSESDRVDDAKDITPSFTLAYSGLINIPLAGAKRKARHVKFYSVGMKGKVGNNIAALETVELTTTEVVSPTQTLVTKKTVYVGEFDRNEFSIAFFADYYQFVGTRDNVGFHLRGTVDAGTAFKPVISFRGGFVFPFTKADDKGSFVNLELFLGINDLFDRAESGSLYDQSVAGIQATFPLSFKTL